MIICIEGPTGSGKSSLAIQLALAINAEIISSDSRQVYRYMDIGTAKVSRQEQDLVKHHLIDIIDPDASYNAGAFVNDAEAIISRQKNIVITFLSSSVRKALWLCDQPALPIWRQACYWQPVPSLLLL